MENVLIVSCNDKSTQLLASLINSNTHPNIKTVTSGSQARRMLINHPFDLVVINTPLSDEFGHELALKIIESSSSQVILLVKTEHADDICAKVEDFGVFVVPKPISRQFFHQALKLVAASKRRIMGLKKENSKLQSKIDEIRLVDRAKCILIEHLGLTEAQAHRYIEKQSMDMRVTKREISQRLLKTYEN